LCRFTFRDQLYSTKHAFDLIVLQPVKASIVFIEHALQKGPQIPAFLATTLRKTARLATYVLPWVVLAMIRTGTCGLEAQLPIPLN
jgi:hypothetical protein